VEWAGIQQAHFLWLGRRNTGKHWATSMVVKLWEIAWDLWDHRNQIKHNNETTQDVARRNSILLAVRDEYAFGRSGLPHRDWRLFQRPLLSILASSLYYLDVWLLRVHTARARHDKRAMEANDPAVTTTAEEHLPNMAGPRQLFDHFLASVSPPSSRPPPCPSLLSSHFTPLSGTYTYVPYGSASTVFQSK
jgi:hypothetical protein